MSSKVVHPKAKITFRRNILPPLIGISMALSLLGLLNAGWLVAQYHYRFRPPANTTAAAPEAPDPKAPARLYIPDINLSAPVVVDEDSYDNTRIQTALQRGVVQFGASADPGERGNVVIVGHSSGQLWAPGDYKFVFTLLDKLKMNDRILVDFKGQRYIFRVDSSKVVRPTDLSVLQHTGEPRLTLITCTPVGTVKDRLVITARQVSPDPATATALDPAKSRPIAATAIPN